MSIYIFSANLVKQKINSSQEKEKEKEKVREKDVTNLLVTMVSVTSSVASLEYPDYRFMIEVSKEKKSMINLIGQNEVEYIKKMFVEWEMKRDKTSGYKTLKGKWDHEKE